MLKSVFPRREGHLGLPAAVLPAALVRLSGSYLNTLNAGVNPLFSTLVFKALTGAAKALKRVTFHR